MCCGCVCVCVCTFGVTSCLLCCKCAVRLFVATRVVASLVLRNVLTVYTNAVGSIGSASLSIVRCTCGACVQPCCQCMLCCIRELQPFASV